MSIKVYLAGDTGPSGFGIATKNLARKLVQSSDVELTLRTHQWGWNKQGELSDNSSSMADSRFKHFLEANNYVNSDYLTENLTEAKNRKNSLRNFTEYLGSNTNIRSEECMVRQFTGKEDIWLAIGGINFAEQAPQDEDIYKILSTDFNLSKVPRSWEYYLDKVDEVWVPSEWTKSAIARRFEDWRDDLISKVKVMKYGINTNYRPTEYDCEACPSQHTQPEPQKHNCLRDSKFDFLVVSRFYHIKGVFRTIIAYLKEFDPDEDVRLFLKTTSNQQFNFDPKEVVSEAISNTDKSTGEHPEIGLKSTPFNQQKMYDLYGHADAFIQASRAECFGIAQLEAAYCGTPVIYNNWSSQKELMDDSNSGMIPIEHYEVEKPSPESKSLMFSGAASYPPDSKWASPSIEAIREKMRQVYEKDRKELDHIGSEASNYVKNNFDWDQKVQERINRMKEVVE